MEVPLVLGVDFLPGDGLHGGGNDHTHNPSPVQSRNGQQVHHRQVDGDKAAEIQHIHQGIQPGGGLIRHHRHLLNNAHRSGHISNARLAGKEHLQAQPDKPDGVQALIPGVLQLSG